MLGSGLESTPRSLASRGRPGPAGASEGDRGAAPSRSAPAFLTESLALARVSREPGGGAVWARRTGHDLFPRSREMVEEERAGAQGKEEKEEGAAGSS